MLKPLSMPCVELKLKVLKCVLFGGCEVISDGLPFERVKLYFMLLFHCTNNSSSLPLSTFGRCWL